LVALVTGANNGIGKEIARQLADTGLIVYVGSRDAARGQRAVAEIGGETRLLALGVTDDASIADAARQAGTLDILVNNAGISGDGAGTHRSRKVAMAQKVTIALEDDLTGGPAAQTVRFAVDGTGYEIDLNATNAAAFTKQLAPYLEHARRTGRAQPRRGGRAAAGRPRSGDVRAWAKEHGLAVGARGRIPAGVLEQYHAAAHGR